MLRKTGLLLLFLCLFAGRVLAAGATVTVNAESTVAGPQITLGELAEISGDDEGLVQALRELKLGNAPSPGNRLLLTADMFGGRLANAGLDLQGVSWNIPPMISIAAAGQAISGETLRSLAAEAIKRQLGAGGNADVTIAADGADRDVFVPLGQATFKVELPQGVRFGTPTTANVVVSVEQKLYTTVSLRFNVKLYKNVLVAGRNIAVAEIIGTDNIRLERRDVSRASGYLTDTDKVLGLRTRRALPAGTVLSEAALEKPPILKQGAVVTILAKLGDITVSASGKALQAGSEGAVIRVQNLNSNKVVSARVLDEATVQVILYNGR